VIPPRRMLNVPVWTNPVVPITYGGSTKEGKVSFTRQAMSGHRRSLRLLLPLFLPHLLRRR
jgi:hypothetical protein